VRNGQSIHSAINRTDTVQKKAKTLFFASFQTTMTFTFGFSNEDIQANAIEAVPNEKLNQDLPNESLKSNIPVIEHDLNEWVSNSPILILSPSNRNQIDSLPSQLSYSVQEITSTDGLNKILIPKRELFDIKTQLMVEDDDDDVLETVSKHDLRTNIYEGGFKTWECSIDLAKYLLDTTINVPDEVIELGAGSALPSLLLFQLLLKRGSENKTLILTDFNSSVLRLLTLSNIFLNWMIVTEPDLIHDCQGEVDITVELKDGFKTYLESKNIMIKFISGPWGDDMISIVQSMNKKRLILASETIYSPESLPSFIKLLIHLLSNDSEGLIAAKRYYFGVGGDINTFVKLCTDNDLQIHDLNIHNGGISRTILKVQKS